MSLRRTPRGAEVGNAKLTDDLVRAIRAKAKDGARNKHLAREFKVSFSTISQVVHGKRWLHVEDKPFST